MGTGWYGNRFDVELVKHDVRNAMRAKHPEDVLAARFPYVPAEVRADLIAVYHDTDERALRVQRFAENAEAFWNEERDRSQSVLRRIWRLFR